MPLIYQRAGNETRAVLASVIEQYHPDLQSIGLTVDLLLASEEVGDKEPDQDGPPILTAHGYPALATVKVTSLKDRAKGLGDAEIVLDEMRTVLRMAQAELVALLDHEVTHLELQIDKWGAPKRDDLGRPKLRMRKHDYQIGWFSDVAERHGLASVELAQVEAMLNLDAVRQMDLFEEA